MNGESWWVILLVALMGATPPTVAELVPKLKALNIPEEKAALKAASLAQGAKVVALGVGFFLLAGALVLIPVFVLKAEPGVAFLIFASLFAVCGMFLVFIGGNMISHEAALAAGGMFGLLAKAVRVARGRNGG